MLTIKVDVEKCRECGFYTLGDQEYVEDDYCGMGRAIEGDGEFMFNPYTKSGAPAPEWCPAREGVKVEAK